MKKALACFAAVFMMFCSLAVPARAVGYTPTFPVYAEAAFIVNTDTNIILFDQNSEEPLTAASLTKLMTVGLLLERYQDQLDAVTATAPNYIYDALFGKNASTADIRSGETVTLRQLLYAMLLPSANEAAYIVADFMGGGSVASFVSVMNRRALELGCRGTVFTDPCGLDPGNMTTARDIYLILRWCMGFPVFAEVCKTETYDMGQNPRYAPGTYILQNTDRMISKNFGAEFYRAYTQGGKTGTLGDWQNFAGWHTEDGVTYISVVLHSPNEVDPYQYPTLRPALFETGELMDWVFSSFAIQAALDVTQPITEVSVRYGANTDTLMLYPADGMSTILPADADGSVTQKTYHLPAELSAPIKKGDVVGSVTLSLSGEVIGTVDLLAGQDVKLSIPLYVLSRLSDFVGSTYLKVVLLLCALVIAVSLAKSLRRSSQKRVPIDRTHDL